MDEFGRLKHDRPMWQIRRNTIEVPSGPSKTRFHAWRGDVRVEADSVPVLAAKITDEERRHGWDRR